jgi:DNA repair protein RecN (Recombination protein N)
VLRRLQIENYGLIEHADVEFADGATMFTGETGSGKTMLIGALDFALGARAAADVVRRGARRAFVSLAFEPDDALRVRLASDGFELDGGELGSVTREMTDTGRSSVRVNGRPSTAGFARELRDAVAEIVGQHEAQRLLSPGYHLELLDRFAGEKAMLLREIVARAYGEAERCAQALARLTRDEEEARRRYEDARLTSREIEETRLEPGEVERLNERRVFLDNVERIATALGAARAATASEESGAIYSLGSASAALATVANFDAALAEMAARAAALQSEAVELAADVARAADGAEYDPGELDAINARLDRIDRLLRRYGPDVAGVGAALERARETVDAYEGRDRQAAALEEESAGAHRALRDGAAALSALRARSAKALSKRVAAEFGEIALRAARFEVALEPLDRIGPLGAERVEFLFVADAGDEPRPLARVASGGELSRVLLALVVALAGARDAGSALVFDEIDAGVGGATATAVGARVGSLARRGQVICVTHLAQLATWADRHYVLDKNRDVITLRLLATAKAREAEVARMLSGESHDVALRHARAMLAKVSGGS